ncbi:HEAT repeat domain-containing protein [candidate division KSB1 bacterium]
MLLFIYAMLLRFFYGRKEKYRAEMIKVWEDSVLDYLMRGETPYVFGLNETERDLLFNIKQKDFQIFGEFIENYLVDLRGEEYSKIVQFLYNLNYDKILINALKKSDKWGKAYAARFLGLIKCKEAEEELLKLIDHKSPIVYLNTYEALNRIGSREDLPGMIESALANRNISNTKIVEIILGFGSEIDQILTSFLKKQEITSYNKALIIDILNYRNVVESANITLRLARKTDDQDLKIKCIKALGTFEDPSAVYFLMECLKDENWIIRSQAANSLGKIGLENTIPELKNLIYTDDNYWVIWYSAIALGAFGDVGEDVLKELLDDPPNEISMKIIQYILAAEEGI